MKSYILVGVQFGTLAILFFTGTVIPTNFASLILILFGIMLGSYSVVIMRRKSKLQALPDLAQNAKLITSGPYKYVRHPMYSGLILVSLGFLFNYFSVVRLAVFLLFLADIYIKMNYEEKLLEKHFEEYKAYKKKTKRIIPFIY